MRRLAGLAMLLLAAGCATQPQPPVVTTEQPTPAPPPPPTVQVPAPRSAPQPDISVNAFSEADAKGRVAHLVLETDLAPIWRDKLASLGPDARRMLLARKIEYKFLHVRDALLFQVVDAARVAEAGALLRQFCAGNDAMCEVAAPDGSGFAVTLSGSFRARTRETMLDQSVSCVTRQLEALATIEPVVRRTGARILVDMPGYADLDTLRRMFGPPSDLSLHRVDDAVSEADIAAGRLPPGETAMDFMNDVTGLAQKPVAVENAVLMSGDRFAYAVMITDEWSGMQSIELDLDPEGGRELTDVTTRNLGHRIAFVMRGQVLEAPVVHDVIPGSALSITMPLNEGAAIKLANLLHADAGHAPWRIVELKLR